MVAAAVRTVFAQPDQASVRGQLDVIAGMLGRQFGKVETALRDACDDMTAFTAFPAQHWKKIWSTNPLSVNRLSGDTFRRDWSGVEPVNAFLEHHRHRHAPNSLHRPGPESAAVVPPRRTSRDEPLPGALPA
jgi:Transposase, Mutator family